MTIYGQPDLVEVIWHDTTGYHQWFTSEDWSINAPMVVRTVGFMVQKNRTMVQLVMSVRDDGGVGDLYIIPRGCVKHIKKLATWDCEWEGEMEKK